MDLQGVTFLDCSGVNMLLATARRARLEGGHLQVIHLSAQAWRIITILGLQYVLTPDDERPKAVTALPSVRLVSETAGSRIERRR